MRFSADGPSIPNHLIEQQSLGNVIFLCGAGLSIPAGLPSFAGLTDTIITALGATKAAKALEDRATFDRAFSLLVREFGRQEVDNQLRKALRTKRTALLDNHKAVLNLSRGPDGNFQVVTTNFDLLFEQADKRVRPIVAPHLPDLELQSRFDGVVYLHGRLDGKGAGTSPGYVISASDFGRAYLADAWATRFVKALRERYTVVLLGYQAEDPPMRYLLEGLNSRGSDAYDSPIYAFVSGEQDNAEEEWFDRGVTPICYDPVDHHSKLWQALSSWSDAVIDPESWVEHLASLARRRPSDLQPFERGQVARLVLSKQGAKAFANIKPPPPADWLCVFDNYVRYAKPRSRDWQDRREIDPLELYGLDDDPARPLPKENGATEIVGMNFLTAQHGDVASGDRGGLFGNAPSWFGALPERLFHLTKWIVSVMDQPASIWWAAGYPQLNPGLVWHVRQRLRDKENRLPAGAELLWRLHNEFTPPPDEYLWYDFKEKVAAEGWSNAAMRSFEALIQPRVELSRYVSAGPCPPEAGWNALSFRQVAEPAVRIMDRHGDTIDIPTDRLIEVVGVLRRSLIRCSQLLSEIEVPYWIPPTLHPELETESRYHSRKAHHLLWLRDLFLRLVDVDAPAASEEVKCWPLNDKFFFGRLAVFAAMHPSAVSRNDAYAIIMRTSDEVFWDRDCQRELLFTLRARWNEFSMVQRRSVERRVIKGPERWEEERAGQYRKRKARLAASRLRWLELNGCPLTEKSAAKLTKLIPIDPRWNDEWAKSADDSLGVKSGWVETVKEVRGLDQQPVSKIIDIANELTEDRHGEFRHMRPFQGLVEARPFLALSALRRSLRSGDRQIRYWINLLSEWPKETSDRLLWLAANTLSRLPPDLSLELRYYLPRWLKDHVVRLYESDPSRAMKVFDGVAACYFTADATQTKSGVGNSIVAGVEQQQSQVSLSKAMNSPVGILAESLWTLLPSKASNRRKMPTQFGSRLAALFGVPGDGGGHAVCVISQHMGWMDYCYGEWVKEIMLPIFDLQNSLSEAAWHGIARDRNGVKPATFARLKDGFLGVLNGNAPWELDKSEYRTQVQRLVYLTKPRKDGPPFISFAEAREALIGVDDQGRSDAVGALANILEQDKSGHEWSRFVKPFLDEAWPRQMRFRTDAVARGFARLAEASGDNFESAVEVVLPFLRPVSHLDMITYRIAKDQKEGSPSLASRFPAATLRILDALVADDRSQMPYGLGTSIGLIAEADPSLKQSKAWRRLNELGA